MLINWFVAKLSDKIRLNSLIPRWNQYWNFWPFQTIAMLDFAFEFAKFITEFASWICMLMGFYNGGDHHAAALNQLRYILVRCWSVELYFVQMLKRGIIFMGANFWIWCFLPGRPNLSLSGLAYVFVGTGSYGFFFGVIGIMGWGEWGLRAGSFIYCLIDPWSMSIRCFVQDCGHWSIF